VDIAASPSAERLGAQLPLKLHEAPGLGVVRADVGLDVGSHVANAGQVDAEQLRALVQRRRDGPARVGVVPSPHSSSSVPNL
jgi:hypothetical protein